MGLQPLRSFSFATVSTRLLPVRAEFDLRSTSYRSLEDKWTRSAVRFWAKSQENPKVTANSFVDLIRGCCLGEGASWSCRRPDVSYFEFLEGHVAKNCCADQSSRPILLNNSLYRVSDRRRSQNGPVFINTSMGFLSTQAFSSKSNASSILPRPVRTLAW